MNKENWGTIGEAVQFYEISQATVHRWRRNGKIKSREAYKGERVGYEYLLDDELKEQIDTVKLLDDRWG